MMRMDLFAACPLREMTWPSRSDPLMSLGCSLALTAADPATGYGMLQETQMPVP